MNNSKLFILAVIFIVVFLGCKFLIQNGGAASGAKAPIIKGKLISGQDFSSDALEGKYVIVDFWGSWCVPCRPVISDLIALQNAQNGTFEIVSIALEKREGAGIKAAEILGLNWTYQLEEVSKFVAFNGTARDYGVTDIPATFLINPKGELVAKMHVAEIRKVLGL
jgi:thiol-disulfide isomerase/thioredoxin